MSRFYPGGLMKGLTHGAGGGAAAITLTALSASDTFGGFPITPNARDGDAGTLYSGDGSSSPWRMVADFSAVAKACVVEFMYRTSAPQQAPGKVFREYWNGSAWVLDTSSGTLTSPNYQLGGYTAGAVDTYAFTDIGALGTRWRWSVTNAVDGTAMPNAIAFAEVRFKNTVGGAYIL